ncbi:protein kinase [Planctomycetota bacterium]
MPVTLEQFVENLIRSGLFTADELAAFQQGLPADRRPQKPQDLARELHKAGRLTKYQAALVYQGKTEGLVLGDYVVLDEIGAGGMGQVFKAWRRDMERSVALKILSAKAMGSPEAVERFRREVKAAARLEHPNIVTAYDAGEAGGVHFLVMQYVEGKDLAHVLAERGPLPVEEAVDCVVQAARGLEYAHQQGIVHRDIKTANLLRDQRGTVKVLDMGLARIDPPASSAGASAPEALTESGQVMGTYDYMAPEQAQDTHAADHRADVYSLGCTLFRLLTDQKPYHGDTPIKTLLAHVQAPIPSVRELREEVSSELDGVVQKMLAKDPADRQQSMGEVIAELEGCIQSSGSPVPEPPTPPPVVEPATSSSSGGSALKAFLKRLSGGAVAARPGPTMAAEETMAPRAEEDTHGPDGRKAVLPTRQKTLLLATVGGTAAVLVVIVGLVMIPGGGGDEAGQKPVGQGTAQKPTKDEEPAELESDPQSESLEWQAAWAETDAKAKALVAEQRFGEAEQLYQGLADQFDDLQSNRKVNDAVTAVEEQAKAAYGEIEARVGKLSGEEKFAEARAALDVVINQHGVAANAEAAKKLLVQIDAAEEEAQVQAAAAQADAARMAEIEKQQQVEQRYSEAIKPIEELVAAWDFRGALAALAKVQFEEEELAARVAAWRDGIDRLVDLKARIIAKINGVEPPLKTTALLIRGAGRDVVKAEKSGLTTRLRNGETEPLPWPDVGPQALDKLIELAGTSDDAGDHVAAGVLALASKNPTAAERHFEEAQSLGAEIGPYLAPLAATALSQARQLVEAEEFSEGEALLANLEAKYADTAWFASNRAAFEAVRAKAKAGIYEAEAEKLYTEAAELFQEEQLFDVKPLVERLKTDYTDSRAVGEAARQPSFAEMEEAVAELGQFITVRQDGQGDFTTIQAAIDAAPPNSLIEIQDSGPYNEKIVVGPTRERLTVRGGRGCWPIITSVGSTTNFPKLLTIDAAQTKIERMVLLHFGGAGNHPRCVVVPHSSASLCSCILLGGSCTLYGGSAQVENCVLGVTELNGRGFRVKDSICMSGRFMGRAKLTLENSLVRSTAAPPSECQIRGCTILGKLRLGASPSTVFDSIMESIESATPESRIDQCNLHGTAPVFIDEAKPGNGCFAAPPQFRDPENLDYRLMPGSPGIDKASDGGDIGCRYTPEMIEIIQKALELRAKGIIKF